MFPQTPGAPIRGLGFGPLGPGTHLRAGCLSAPLSLGMIQRECSSTDLFAPQAYPHHRSGMDAPDQPVSTQGALSARADRPEAKRPDGRARRLREHSPGGAITKPKKGCGVGGSSRPGSPILR